MELLEFYLCTRGKIILLHKMLNESSMLNRKKISCKKGY